MRVEPKALVRRLTPTATRMLEAAVARASSARAYEIVLEHMLRADAGGRGRRGLAASCATSRWTGKVLARVERHAARPAHRQRRPAGVLREPLPVVRGRVAAGLLEQGALRLRSGALMAQFDRSVRPLHGRVLPGAGCHLHRGAQEGLRGGGAALQGGGGGRPRRAPARPGGRGGSRPGARRRSRASPPRSPARRARGRSIRSSAATARSVR